MAANAFISQDDAAEALDALRAAQRELQDRNRAQFPDLKDVPDSVSTVMYQLARTIRILERRGVTV